MKCWILPPKTKKGEIKRKGENDMSAIIELFEPVEAGTWILRVILLYVLSYITLWVLAFILSRFKYHKAGGAIFNVYLGWLIPFTMHSVFFVGFLLLSAKYYKDMGLSLWYCLIYLIPVFLDGFLGIDLSRKIRERLKKEAGK
jgi:hypothetical protein